MAIGTAGFAAVLAVTALEDHDLQPKQGEVLVTGAAGGVGSILIQLARQLTNLTIVATASRPKTRKWVKEMGAHHVIDHSSDMKAQLEKKKLNVDLIAGLTATETQFPAYAKIIKPQGKLVLIDVELLLLKLRFHIA